MAGRTLALPGMLLSLIGLTSASKLPVCLPWAIYEIADVLRGKVEPSQHGWGLSSCQTCFPHSHVWFPITRPWKPAPHKPPSQTPSPETLIRGTSQHSLCPTLTYIAFLGAPKAPFLSSAKAPTTWGEVMHLCPSSTKWKPLEDDHIYSTLSL